MFFTYVYRELRRRHRQALLTALGLALGVGLVVTVTAATRGVDKAQDEVLHSLYGIGTDITVTQAAEQGSFEPSRFGMNPNDREEQGEAFARDRVMSTPGMTSFSADKKEELAALEDVDAVAAGLSLTAIHIEGELPKGSMPPGAGEAGGPAGASGVAGSQDQPRPEVSMAPIEVDTYSIAGVDVEVAGLGPLTASQIDEGRMLDAADAKARVAVADASFAAERELEVGDKLSISGTKYEVVGIAATPASGQATSVYLPLARAQKLAGDSDTVNQLYVRASSADTIATVKASIEEAFPKADVTTADDLASQVSGSLSSASKLADRLGTWVAGAALVAAAALAILLTLSSVGRRVREFGTLKAIGWRSRRVVGQVIGEATVTGIFGGVLGLGLGLAGAALIERLSPSLEATVSSLGQGAGAVPPGAEGMARQAGVELSNTIEVAMTAPVSAELVALAVGLALAGALLAGCIGGWRAARLRPADALRRVD